MEWIAISGGWRKVSPEIEIQIRQTVGEIVNSGKGLVSGGALGVDFISLDEALKKDLKAKKIKIFLPTTLEKYIQHYRKQADLGRISQVQAQILAKQLKHLKSINPQALIENPDINFTEATKKKMYYERNGRIVQAADKLITFHIETPESKGLGTKDTIRKKKGIPVEISHYFLN